MARMKSELKMAKKAAPRGEAKKRKTSAPVAIVGRRAWKSSSGPLGEGGSRYPIWRDVIDDWEG